MKITNKEMLKNIIPKFTKDCIVIIEQKDILNLAKVAKAVFYNTYKADDIYKAVRISERINCEYKNMGKDNKAALYFTGDPEMDEVAEILDGLEDTTNYVIWGSCNDNCYESNELKVAVLFFEME